MQENSLSKNREEAGSDVVSSPNGQLACNSVRPWPVLMAIYLSAVLPVLFVVFAVFVILGVCSGNCVIDYPFVAVPLFLALVVQLVRVEIGLYRGENWARHWVMKFALVWLIGIGGGLLSGGFKGPIPFFVVVILVPIFSRIVPAILLALPSVRCWFKNERID